MTVAAGKQRRKATADWIVLGLRVHAGNHSELKMASDREGYSMELILHGILCEKFGRDDLKGLTPTSA